MTEIIDKEATFIGDMHRALLALQMENRALRQQLAEAEKAWADSTARMMHAEIMLAELERRQPCKADIWLSPFKDSETT